ncbi:MAG: hypothetical protein AB1405_06515 [Bdellovibrionota bacterium]
MKFEILFKDKKTAEELPKVDLRIKGILADAAFFLGTRGYPCLVTCLWRSSERQAEIRKKAEKEGKKEPVKSPHEFWRAADLSIQGIPDAVISELVSYLNEKYPYDESGRYKTALRHDVGFGDHVHIQVSWQVPANFRWVA